MPGSPFDLRPRREPTAVQFEWVFPYAPVPAGRPLPVIRVWLELPGLPPWEVPLAFDSAADLSLVDGGWAIFRGFDPTAGARRLEPVRGVGGTVTAYVHEVVCHLSPPGDSAPQALRLTLPTAFTHPNAPPPPLNVLGREGFLDHLAVGIEGYVLPPRLYLALRRPPRRG